MRREAGGLYIRLSHLLFDCLYTHTTELFHSRIARNTVICVKRLCGCVNCNPDCLTEYYIKVFLLSFWRLPPSILWLDIWHTETDFPEGFAMLPWRGFRKYESSHMAYDLKTAVDPFPAEDVLKLHMSLYWSMDGKKIAWALRVMLPCGCGLSYQCFGLT
jgi:hypothetical protein